MAKLNGFNELEKHLKQMQKVARELDGAQTIPFKDLFPTSFMAKHTKTDSISTWFEGYEHYSDIPEDKFNEMVSSDGFTTYIKETTSFDNWEDMIKAATSEYISSKLGF